MRELRTLGDALLFLPKRYEDRRYPQSINQCVLGQTVVLKGVVRASSTQGRWGKVYRLVLADDSGAIDCLWFRFKKAYLAGFKPGEDVYVVGEASRSKQGALQLVHPDIFHASDVGPDHGSIGRVIPVYPQVEGVRPGSLRRIMKALFRQIEGKITDPLFGLLPAELYPLPAGRALAFAHEPPFEATERDLDPDEAAWRLSLAVNELFYYELGLALNRRKRAEAAARSLEATGELGNRFIESLGFELTLGQKKAVSEIKDDMARTAPMARLLAGDVGTGKTAVACAAACAAMEAGAQVAFMAPTEVLARQHLATMEKLLGPLGVSLALATGSLDARGRRQAREAAENGAQMVLGTHALLSEGFEFRDLGLVIIDEQHRFGVEQRLVLTAKGQSPHLLVLSATPIPRTLALAISGHMDISDLPEKPNKRPPVATYQVDHAGRRQAVDAITRALDQGEQVYVVCPLVEPSEHIDAKDVISTHRGLDAYFPEVEVGLLHGRMESSEQQEVLDRFRQGQCRILVSTTVVEVGVDVAEATLMVILGSERFGLSQLHQLRGRVGRGDRPGSCYLVAGPKAGDLARRRMEVLCTTNDGLKVAEADLSLRGPGEALGARQAGLPPFKVADWARDGELTVLLRNWIEKELSRDTEMQASPLKPLGEECLRRWGRRLGLVKAG
jgi:ATP-dependent DNA helicase RecG